MRGGPVARLSVSRRGMQFVALVSVAVALPLVTNLGMASAASGDLVFHGCNGDLSGCTATSPSGALDGAEQAAVSGSNLYVAAASGDAISHFTLGPAGKPTFVSCIGNLSGCTAMSPAGALNSASGLAVSGTHMYVTAGSVVSYFTLDSAGKPTFVGCIGNLTGCTATSPAGALGSSDRVQVHGSSLYVSAFQDVSYFTLNSSGVPSFGGCVGAVSGCTPVSPSNALNGANAMAVAGTNLYVAASFGSNVSHFTLASDGTPTFAGCIGRLSGCTSTNPTVALTDADGVAVSGNNLYATGSSNSSGGPGAVSQLTLDSTGTPSFDLCVGEKTGCTAITPAGALENAADVVLSGNDLYVTWLDGVSHLRLSSTGVPQFLDCIGSLTGCAAATPAGALAGGGITLSRQNVYVASPTSNALSHLSIPPVVTSLVPNAGPTAGGNTVVIKGSGFTTGSKVKFGSVLSSSVTFVSSTTLKAVAPAQSSAVVGVVVTTSVGTSPNAPSDDYAYGAPTLSSFTPSSGITGSTVTIDGSKYVPGMSVKFGNLVSPKVTFVSTTQIKAVVPDAAVAGRISVSDNAGSAASTANFTPTLSITSFSPTNGPVGTMVTVSGIGFNSSSIVAFHGSSATTTFVSSSQLKATVPSAATTGSVTVTNSAAPIGTVTSATSYTVT